MKRDLHVNARKLFHDIYFEARFAAFGYEADTRAAKEIIRILAGMSMVADIPAKELIKRLEVTKEQLAFLNKYSK